MRIASPSPSSFRAVARVLLAAVLISLGLAAAGLFQPDQTAAADPLWACYHRSNFSLRYVADQDDCTRLENDIRLDNSAQPIWICLHPASGVLRYAGNGSLPVSSRCTGASPSNIKKIPGDTETPLCVTTSTGQLTFPPCGPGQTPLTIPRRNTAPVAQNKTASLLEEQSVVVQLSASDADGQNLTFAITQQPANGGLSAITGTSCTGTVPKTCTANVTYTPNSNFFGSDTFKYKANDTIADSNIATVSITVTNVNDTPAFTSGGNVTVNEDSGAYNQAWATGVTAGPNEDGVQTVSFEITNNTNTALFSAGPTVSSTGALAFTPAGDAFGEADITLKIEDNGGTANGGDDESDTQTFKITVNSVNDRPTFAILGNQSVGEDAGGQTVTGFALSFDPGPANESTQTVLDYKVSTDEDELFSVQPDISDTGVLTYTPADDASGVATVRVRVQDDGGTANGGQDTSDPALEFTITISAVNDAPTITLEDDTVTTLEDTELEFSSANGNLISVDDVDAGTDEVEITLGVTTGKLTLDSTNGLTFTPANDDNNGSNDANMTFTGTLGAVNAALSGLRYIPNANVNGSDTLTITIDDQGNNGSGGALDATDTVAITITAVNDPPSFTSAGGVTVNEDSGPHSSTWATSISDGPADESGQTVTFSLSNNSNPTLFASGPSLAPDGTLTFTPALNAFGTATLDVVLTDTGGTANNGDATSATQTLTITVDPVNDAPSFELAGAQTVAEDSGPHTVEDFATQISPGPANESTQTVTFTVTNDNNGLFSTQPDIDETTGDLTYALATNANGSALVTVSLADNGTAGPAPNDNTSADQTFTIAVTAVNDAPVLTAPSTLAVTEDVAATVTGISVADVDAGSGNLTLTLSVPSGQGTFTAGPHSSFSVTGSGTNELTITAVLSTINAYIANGVSFTTAANAVADVAMTVTINDQGNTGADPGASGTATSEADSATVTIDVTRVNDVPSFTLAGATVSVLENSGPTTITALATNISAGAPDEEPPVQELTFVHTPGTVTGTLAFAVAPTIDPTTGNLTFTLTDGTTGSATFSVVLRDDNETPGVAADDLSSAPQQFTIATNQIPSANTQNLYTPEDTGVAITLTASDGDLDPLTYIVLSLPAHGTLYEGTNATGNVIGSGDLPYELAADDVFYAPALNYNGDDSFTFKANDGQDDSNTVSVDIVVTPLNDPPTANAMTVSTDEDIPLGMNLVGNDNDPEQTQGLTFTITDQPDHGGLGPITQATGAVTYTPALHYNGPDSFAFTVTDDAGTAGVPADDSTSAPATISITVNAIDDAPVNTVPATTQVVNEDAALVFSTGDGNLISVADLDAAEGTGIIQVALTAQNGTVTLNGTSGLTVTAGANGTATVTVRGTIANLNTALNGLVYLPNGNFNSTQGTAGLTIVTNDLGQTGHGGPFSDTDTIAITVTSVNDKPVLTGLESTTITFTENGAATQLTNAIDVTDVDGTTLTGATVTIGSFVTGQDVLAVTLQPGITGGFSPTTGVLTLTASPAVAHATFETVLRSVTYQNTSDDPTAGNRVISFQVNDGQSANNLSDAVTRTVNVVAVNDPPQITGEPYSFTIDENLANATNVGTPITYTDPEAAQTRTFSITGGNSLGAFAINGSTGQITVADTTDLNFEVTPSFSLTVQVQDNGTGNLTDTTTVAIALNNVNEAPTATLDTYGAFGNTQLRVASPTSPPAAVAHTTSTTNPITNDTDPDTLASGFANLSIVPGSLTCIKGATATIENTGKFTFLPGPGQTDASVPAGATTCTYQLTDGTNTVNGTIQVNLANMVWYVRNNTTVTPDTGTSVAPFNTLAEAGTASAGNDIIYVLTGNGLTTGQDTGISLKTGQKLWGQGVDLVVGATTLITTGTPPAVGNGAGNGVTVDASAASLTNVEIRGLSLSGSVNAIDVTSGGSSNATVTINTNAITGAGSEGIDVNAGSTGVTTVDVQNNTIASTGNGFDARSTAGTFTITFSTNTGITSGATGVLIDGSGGGTTRLIGFANNTVAGATASTGISVTSTTIDANPGTVGFQQVLGGTTTIGASGNGVGAGGMILTNVSGDLSFTNLAIFADGGIGLGASGTTTYTGSAGLQVVVTGSTSVIEATGGHALNLTLMTANLPLSSIESTNSFANGVLLTNVLGTVSAGSDSAITNATASDFGISGGTATVTYNGTITDTSGTLVAITGATGGTKTFTGAITDSASGSGGGISLTTNGGATIRFSGGLALSTGANAGFTATGGGTVEVCAVNPCGGSTAVVNTITTTTGTALNVASTTIGGNDLTFRSISAGTAASGPASGIILNTTGTSGGLTVTGDGTGAANGSGGLIQKTSGSAISLTSTRDVSLTQLNVDDTGSHAINISSVTNLTYQDASVVNGGDTNDEHAIRINNLFGSSTIEDVTLDNIWEDGIEVRQSLTDDGTADSLTIRRLNVQDHTIGGTGEAGIEIQTDLASNITILVDDSDFAINDEAIMGVAMSTAASHTGNLTVTVQNSVFNCANAFGSGSIQALGGGSGNATYVVTGNQVNNTKFSGILINNDDTGTTRATVTNNVLDGIHDTVNNVYNNGNGIQMRQDQNGTMIALISGNTFRDFSANSIYLQAQDNAPDDANREFDATVTNNTTLTAPFDPPGAGVAFGAGLLIEVGTGDPSIPSNNDMCADISGNNFIGTNTTPFFDFDITLQLNDTTGASLRITQASSAALSTANNGDQVSFFANPPNTITFNGGSCTQP